MSVIAARLAELGLELPGVAKPVAAYVPAVVTGNLVFTAGQLPFVDGKLLATGKVGDAVTPEEAATLARRCALNALAAAAEAIGSLDRVTRVVKAVVFVNSAPGFTGQPGVANGGSISLVATGSVMVSAFRQKIMPVVGSQG